MKTKAIHFTLMGAVLISFNIARAQEPDTISIKKTTDTVIKDTVTREVIIHDTVIESVQPVTYPLHKGEVGLRFMPTFSSLALRTYNGEVIQSTATASYGYGLMLGLNLTKHVGFQAEVNYYEASQKYKDQGLERVVHINYLNIPVMLSLNTDKSAAFNLNAVVGPQFGLNVGASTSTNGNRDADTLKAVLAVKEGDVGLAYGAGIEIMLNQPRTLRLDLGFRGFYGLVDMNADSSSNGNSNTYNILVKATRKTYGAYAGLTFLF